MEIRLPETVRNIIGILQNAGYEAYAVGGCIRDSILGREPNDWDITTSALPAQVKALFRRTVDTGIEHGTVTVLLDGGTYEVTTYRVDGEYADARHPQSVSFVKNLREDLQRRDFTINAMAYNEEEGLQDPFGGYQDLQAHLIRCVGSPEERFSEDALRIFRAVRFSAQLFFKIEPETEQAIRLLSPTLAKISAERICTELTKLITSPHPETIREAWRLGLTAVFLPEFDRAMETPQNNRFHIYSVGEHTIRTMHNIAPDRILRLTMLLHDIAKPRTRTVDGNGTDHFRGHGPLGAQMAKDIMRRLRMDNETIRKVSRLVYYHDWLYPAEIKNVRRAANELGEELFEAFLKVQRADTMAKSDYLKKERLENLEKQSSLFQKILAERQCISLKGLAITGADVINLGCTPGPEIGRLLQSALDLVLEDPTNNKKEILLEYVQKVRKSGGA